jgi:hypothetical protein
VPKPGTFVSDVPEAPAADTSQSTSQSSDVPAAPEKVAPEKVVPEKVEEPKTQ